MKSNLTPTQESKARKAFCIHFHAEYGRPPDFLNLHDVTQWHHFRAGWEMGQRATQETQLQTT